MAALPIYANAEQDDIKLAFSIGNCKLFYSLFCFLVRNFCVLLSCHVISWAILHLLVKSIQNLPDELRPHNINEKRANLIDANLTSENFTGTHGSYRKVL
jgi:hypothetical protein